MASEKLWCRFILKTLFILGFLLQTVYASELKHSEKLPLTPQLQKGALPWFVARDRSDKEPFSKKHLETFVGAQTKRVAIVFFATWCLPCREGVVILRDKQAELDKHGVQVVLVNTGENEVAKVEEWIKANGNKNWLILIDKFKNIQKNTGLISSNDSEIVFPKTILMDRELKPILLIGAEGKDWPQILWE